MPDETVEQVAETIRSLRAIMSYRAMAPVFGVSASTIYRIARLAVAPVTVKDGRLQVPVAKGLDGRMRPAVRYDTTGRDARIMELREDGLTIRAIAAEVGCSVGTVHRVISREES